MSQNAPMTLAASSGGVSDEIPVATAARVVSRFEGVTPLETFDFPDKGNINQYTFLIRGGIRGEKEYLLQQINQQVFTRPASVMKAMIACLDSQNSHIARHGVPSGREWETIELIPTREGIKYLEIHNLRGASYWRLMVKIPDCRTYKSLGELSTRTDQFRIAEEAGRGLAMFGDFTAGMDISGLENPLPGYRDTRVYFNQFKSVLAGNRTLTQAADWLPKDPVVRQSTEQHFHLHLPQAEHERRMGDPAVQRFVSLVLENEEFGTTLLRGLESGEIRRLAIHGDTKLDNFLFSTTTGQAKALIDLDTIMPHTWLADWGDMVRSLCNVAGEKEKDLSRVDVDMGIYAAIAKGFLSTASSIQPPEVALMAEAVEIISLELGIRFLSDYLRGDSYFKLGSMDPPDLNRTRGFVQLTLFERLREKQQEAKKIIRDLSTKQRQ